MSDQFPFFPMLPIYAFHVLFGLVLVAQIGLLRQRRFWCTLLAIPFLYLASSMVRNLPLLVVTCVPAAAWGMGEFKRKVALSPAFQRGLATAVVLVCATLSLRVLHDAYYIETRRPDRFGMGWNRSALPVDASDYIVSADLPGRMLNHLGFGGTLMWATRKPVFIDSRLEVIGEQFFQEYRRTLAFQTELELAVARYGIGWIALDYKLHSDALRRLSRDPRWQLTYVDHLAAIFVRNGPNVDALIDESAQDALAPPLELVEFESLQRAGDTSHWARGLVRREDFPNQPFSLGLFHYFRTDAPRAAPWFARAVHESGGAYYEIYLNLGSALYRIGRLPEAEHCYRIVLEDDPDSGLARARLAEIRQRRREPERSK